MDKVTIIIPVYNAEKTIEKCISSVLNQTYKNLEILVIDDGSKDNSFEVIKSIDDPRIKAIKKKNEGVAVTRNKGIKMALGKYIMFIDNDDFIDEDYVETHVNNIKDNDIVISGYRRPNEEGKIILELKLEDIPYSKMLVFAPWAKLYRKDFLIKNNIQFLDTNIGEDVYFNLYAVLKTDKIKILDYIGYNWFFNSKSVSNTIQKDFRDLQVFKLLNKCYDKLKQEKLIEKNYEMVEYFFIRYVSWFLSFSTRRRKYKEISKIYDELFDWLKERFPNYKKNKQIGLSTPKGETKSTRKLVFLFMIFHKIKLGKLLVFLYSRR